MRDSRSSINNTVGMNGPATRPPRGRSPEVEDKSLPTQIPARTRTWREQGAPAALPSDLQSLPQVTVRGFDGVAHVAKQLPGRVDRAKFDP